LRLTLALVLGECAGPQFPNLDVSHDRLGPRAHVPKMKELSGVFFEMQQNCKQAKHQQKNKRYKDASHMSQHP